MEIDAAGHEDVHARHQGENSKPSAEEQTTAHT